MRTNLFLNKKTLCTVIILFVTLQLFGQFTKLYDFSGNDGRYPISEFVNSGDTIFGTTIQGGENWNGTIFRIKSDGTNFKNLYTFKDTNGMNPCGQLFIKGSILYGTTRLGGRYFKGNLFKMDTNGNNFQTLFNFMDSLGTCPESPLLFIGDTIFGIAGYGGKYQQGVLFRINIDGNNYKKLKEFDGTSSGNPFGSMVFLNNYLFGVTSNSIYKIKTDGSDYQIIKSFTGTNNGIPAPTTSLLLIDSTFYGGACAGNSYSNIYKIKTDGTGFEEVFNFPAFSSVLPQRNLTFWNGIIFGMSLGNNTIFRVSTDGKDYNIIYNFRDKNGTYPLGSLLQMNNCLYGMTHDGGLNGDGIVFKYNIVATVPNNQANRISISDLVCTHVKISWTRGNGTDCAVFVREGRSESFPIADNTEYTANPVFGKGSQINNSGWYCVYNGTDSSVTVTGLKPVTNYQIMVSEYNIALKGDEKYNIQKSMNNPSEQKTIKCNQSIFFDLLPIETYGDTDFDPEAKSSSGLNVSYSIDNTNVAIIQNNIIKILTAGETNIIASQAGDSIYFPAANVSRSLTVNKALLTVKAVDTTREAGHSNPVFRLIYSGFIATEDSTVLAQTPSVICNANINSPSGIYDIIVSGGLSNNYDFKFINGKLTVVPVTGIKEKTMDKVKIYPNPADAYLFFKKSQLTVDHIQILNISGNIIIDRFIKGDMIEVSFLPTGLYFLRINDNWYKFEKK